MTNINEKPLHISKEEKNGITQELVKGLFDYKDGKLYWKTLSSIKTKIGDLAGYIHTGDYNVKRYIIKYKAISYKASRIIFLWHHGWLPEIVDHEDRNSLNDLIENLRPATYHQNSMNCTSQKNSSSRYLGVNYESRLSKWKVQICFNRKKIYLGVYISEIEAALAYNKAAVKYFGEFAHLNIIKSE
jgi:hypothetical protein